MYVAQVLLQGYGFFMDLHLAVLQGVAAARRPGQIVEVLWPDLDDEIICTADIAQKLLKFLLATALLPGSPRAQQRNHQENGGQRQKCRDRDGCQWIGIEVFQQGHRPWRLRCVLEDDLLRIVRADALAAFAQDGQQMIVIALG